MVRCVVEVDVLGAFRNETDKAAMDVPAAVAGTIQEVLVKVGDKVSEGTAVAIIEAVGAAAGRRRLPWRRSRVPAGPPAGEYRRPACP